MKILGLNGLGISPSACIVEDGNLLVFAEEERFNRVKDLSGVLPKSAVKFCLNFSKIDLSEIDYIAFSWDCNLYRTAMPIFLIHQFFKRGSFLNGGSNKWRFIEEIIKYMPSNVEDKISGMFKEVGFTHKVPPIKFIPHHLSHAASTFFVSGFDKAIVLVIDGSGEKSCTSIYKGDGPNIKLLKSIKMPDSLGWFYQTITEFLGFKPNSHEGKMMALAAYGKFNESISNKLKEVIQINPKNYYYFDATYSYFGCRNNGLVYSDKMIQLFGKPRKSNEPITDFHKNLAFNSQKMLEDIVLNIMNEEFKKQDFNGNVCLAGGVTLNCKMNGLIAQHPLVSNIYSPPFASDAGSALGAALFLSSEKGIKKSNPINHSYWGSEYTNEQIEEVLVNYRARYEKHTRIDEVGASLLQDNKVIGWFQGRMEAGPRALGARSILGNPLTASMRDTINIKVKSREVWRPFASSILYEDRSIYFEKPIGSDFMTVAQLVKEDARKNIIAAIHIDGTTRPQLVNKSVNEKYWRLISEFKKLSGVGAVLNTSFNNNEEPIVENPEQALRTFYSSGLDYLLIGDFLVKK
jgi:carbamoyltransferase